MLVTLAGSFDLTDEQKKVLTELGARFEDRDPVLHIHAYESADIWGALPDIGGCKIYSNLSDYIIHPSEEKYTPGIVKNHKEEIDIIPIYAYIHSCICLSLDGDSYPFNDKWDAGVAGFAVFAKANKDSAKQDLQKYIDAYNDVVGTGLYSVYILDEFDNEVECLGEMPGSQVNAEAEKRNLSVKWS